MSTTRKRNAAGGIVFDLNNRLLKGSYNLLSQKVFNIELSTEGQNRNILPSSITNCSFSNNLLLTSTETGSICLFNSKFEYQDQILLENTVTDVQWFPISSQQFACSTNIGVISLHDVESSSILKWKKKILDTKTLDCIRSITIVNNEQLIGWATVNGTFGVEDLREMNSKTIVNQAHKVKGYKTCGISSIIAQSNQQVITGGSTDGIIKFWDLRNIKQCVKEISRLKEGNHLRGQGIVNLDLHSDNKLLCTRRGGQISVHNINTDYARVYYLNSNILDDSRACAKFSPSGLCVGVSGNENCMVFSLENEKQNLVLEMDGGPSFLGGCEWNKNTNSFIACTSNGEIIEWEYKYWGLKRPKLSQSLIQSSSLILPMSKRVCV